MSQASSQLQDISKSGQKGVSTFRTEEFQKKSKFLCLFCGGKTCSKENFLKNPHENAIYGLHSDWITPDVLAMQRPSSRIIREYNIVESFKKAQIQAVFNLQLPGEHPYCGDGLQRESGFTYMSEDFTDHNIYFFNFGWTDMEVTTNDYMIKILTHIDFIINSGMKISVHCHAGTGRTGLVIASWLIFKKNMTAKEAKDLFRSKRSGGLSKGIQYTFLVKFEEFLQSSRISFSLKQEIKLKDLVIKQEKIVFGKAKSQSRYQPFIMHQILTRLEFLMKNNRITPKQICYSFCDLENKEAFGEEKWNREKEEQITKLKDQINRFEWQFSGYGDCRVISQTLLDFLDQPNFQAIKNESALKLEKTFENLESVEKVFSNEEIVAILGRYEYAVMSRFLVFIKCNLVDLGVGSQAVNQFLLRICISLLGKRKELDDLFIERSFLTTECFNPVVFSLYQFSSLWLQDMISSQMSDNSFFNSTFNRTATMIEGKKMQLKQSPKSKLSANKVSPIKPLSQSGLSDKNAESLVIGSSSKKNQNFGIENQDNNKREVSNFTNIDVLPPLKNVNKAPNGKLVIPQPRLNEQKNVARQQPKNSQGDKDEDQEEEEQKHN